MYKYLALAILSCSFLQASSEGLKPYKDRLFSSLKKALPGQVMQQGAIENSVDRVIPEKSALNAEKVAAETLRKYTEITDMYEADPPTDAAVFIEFGETLVEVYTKAVEDALIEEALRAKGYTAWRQELKAAWETIKKEMSDR